MLEYFASLKYVAVMYFINTMYTYDAINDNYFPKYGVVQGTAMRQVIDGCTDYSLAQDGHLNEKMLVVTDNPSPTPEPDSVE